MDRRLKPTPLKRPPTTLKSKQMTQLEILLKQRVVVIDGLRHAKHHLEWLQWWDVLGSIQKQIKLLTLKQAA
jgi:hypothetical protein